MWGSANWGDLVWGGAAVPTMPLGMLLLLMVGCFLAGGYFLRPERRTRRNFVAAASLVMLPISVAAVTLPFSFQNGTIADASEVNANFTALADASEVQCPSGMSTFALTHTTLCYATAPVGTWDQASALCRDQFGARICNVQQWRAAICTAGATNPGSSWTDSITGSGSVGVVSGCTAETFTSSPYQTQRATTCCIEWPRY